VLPRHTLPFQSVEAAICETIQRNVLHYCIAITITAVLLTRHCVKNASNTDSAVPVMVSRSTAGRSDPSP
jgi:hypothetical protein